MKQNHEAQNKAWQKYGIETFFDVASNYFWCSIEWFIDVQKDLPIHVLYKKLKFYVEWCAGYMHQLQFILTNKFFYDKIIVEK